MNCYLRLYSKKDIDQDEDRELFLKEKSRFFFFKLTNLNDVLRLVDIVDCLSSSSSSSSLRCDGKSSNPSSFTTFGVSEPRLTGVSNELDGVSKIKPSRS